MHCQFIESTFRAGTTRAAVLALLLGAAQALAGEQLLGGAFGPVRSDVFVPDVRVVGGFIGHAMNAPFGTAGRWAGLCRELGFAPVAMSTDRMANNRPPKLAGAGAESIEDFGALSGQSGLAHARGPAPGPRPAGWFPRC